MNAPRVFFCAAVAAARAIAGAATVNAVLASQLAAGPAVQQRDEAPVSLRYASGAQSSVDMPADAWGRIAGVVRRVDVSAQRVELAITDEAVFPQAGKWRVFRTLSGTSEPGRLSFRATADATAWAALKTGDRVSMRCRGARDGGLEIAGVEKLETTALRATNAHRVTNRHDMRLLLLAMAEPTQIAVSIDLRSTGVEDMTLKTSQGAVRPYAMYYKDGQYSAYGVLDPSKPSGPFDAAFTMYFAIDERVDQDAVRLEFRTVDGSTSSVPVTLLANTDAAHGAGQLEAKQGTPVRIRDNLSLTARWERTDESTVTLDDGSPRRTVFLPPDVAIARITFDGAATTPVALTSRGFMLIVRGADGKRRAVSAVGMTLGGLTTRAFSTANHGASFTPTRADAVEVALVFGLRADDAVDSLLIGSCSACPDRRIRVR